VTRRTLRPPGHTQPIGAYSAGVAVIFPPGAELLFVSGQVASDASGALVHPGDPAMQAEYVFDRIEAVLAEAGGRLSDLASVTIFLCDMADFALVSPVRDRRLAGIAPASTLVEVSRLAIEGHLVEINAIAVLPPRTGDARP